MKFLKRLFGDKAGSKPSSELLKDATQLKKDGDIEAAIHALRQAYDASSKEGVFFGTDTYLRLPKYLLEAGRADEAWAEYNRMLSEGSGGRRPPIEIMYSEHAQIYGAMGGHLKKEKKYFNAGIFSAMSSLAWSKGLIAQDRKHDLGKVILDEKAYRNLLKKARLERITDEFIGEVKKALQEPDAIDCGELANRLKKLK